MRTSVSIDLLYESIAAGLPCWFRYRAGAVRDLPLQRWLGTESSPEDQLTDRLILRQCTGPMIDLGCGPGRFVSALTEIGIPAMGVDVSAAAVDLTVQRGGMALCQDLFDPLPSTGMWGSVLLADGNIGIGGDPLRLLRRARELLAADGVVLVELSTAPGELQCEDVRVENERNVSEWFPWAHVGADAAAHLAARSGLRIVEILHVSGRTIARMCST